MDYERIRKQCEAFARRKGFPQDAEDFASEVLIYLIQHPDCPGLFINRWFVGFLRKHYGDTRLPGGLAKSRARLDAGAVSSEDVASHTPSGPTPRQIGRRLAGISGTEKQVYAALEVLGQERSGRDVADELGVTESRVSQMVGDIKKRLSEAIILEECLPEYLEDEERQTLEVRWIEL